MPHLGALAIVLLSLLALSILVLPATAIRDEEGDSKSAASVDGDGDDWKVVQRHSPDSDTNLPPSSAAELGEFHLAGPPKPELNTGKAIMQAYGQLPKTVKKKKRFVRRRKGTGKTADAAEIIRILQPLLTAGANKEVKIVRRGEPTAPTEEEEPEQDEVDPKERIAIDPCCDSSSTPAAEGANADGTYTLTVKHSGLSLSESGKAGTCKPAHMSMPVVEVEYLCPKQCFADPHTWEDFKQLMEDNPLATEDDAATCLSTCHGQCYDAHKTKWYSGSVVSAAAPRLRGCTVTGGSGANSNGFAMTTGCTDRFEDWRQLYWAERGQ